MVRELVLPKGLFEKLRSKHPHLSQKDCELVARGLRKYFLVYLKSRHQFVAMPSVVVDDLWHEFILYTRNYQRFCEQAFGQFFHHTPAAVLEGGARTSNQGLRRCWWYACKEENISPKRPTRLPLLFALDAKLNIQNGFRYALDCRENGGFTANSNGANTSYCVGDLSSADGPDSGSSTQFDGMGDVSDGSGSDGCGGGGCGGGD